MDDSLFFHVGTIRCSIPVSSTTFVLGMVQIQDTSTGSPQQEPAATFNLHGVIVPVYCMRNFLGEPYRPARPTDVLIIAKRDDDDVALWVDGIDIVQDISSPVVSASIATGDSAFPGAVMGNDGCIHIIDLNRFLEKAGKMPLPFSPSNGVFTTDSGESYDEILDPGQIQEILTERAKIVARPRVENPERERIEILRFRLMYHEYAIEMKYLREVVLTGEITPVPGTPPFISGICAIRGEVISLVDLRILFALPEKGLTDLNRVLVLTNERMTFGILADAITGTGKIPRDTIISDNSGVVSPAKRYVLGETDEGVTVLDAAAILNDPHMIVNQSGAEPQIPW